MKKGWDSDLCILGVGELSPYQRLSSGSQQHRTQHSESILTASRSPVLMLIHDECFVHCLMSSARDLDRLLRLGPQNGFRLCLVEKGVKPEITSSQLSGDVAQDACEVVVASP
ncbi:unnamed protein product [Calypogeia fissa]